ncbi:MAG: extracellular solute-binding protein [Anaerolineales bacterium]
MSIIQIQKVIKSHWRKIGAGLLGFLFIASTAYYGWQVYGIDGNSPVQLIVYAFSTQEEVFTQGIFPAFEQSWESTADTDLIIKGVFGPSGTLAGQINLGAPADVAIFSNENHINWLKIGHLIEDDVQPLSFGTSPVVIVTRPGNPAGIEDFSDLSQPDLILLHADPRSSGAGEWSLIAVYGSIYLETEDESTSLKQLQEIWNNVHLMAPSARATLTLFELGAGDALITYEQDAMLAQDRGVALDIVIPSPTILTQPAAVAINKNITRSERAAVQAFLDFLSSPQGQTIFARYHLRPASPEGSEQFPQINTFTTKDLGGWAIVYSQRLKPYWEKEILPALSLDEESSIINWE